MAWDLQVRQSLLGSASHISSGVKGEDAGLGLFVGQAGVKTTVGSTTTW